MTFLLKVIGTLLDRVISYLNNDPESDLDWSEAATSGKDVPGEFKKYLKKNHMSRFLNKR